MSKQIVTETVSNVEGNVIHRANICQAGPQHQTKESVEFNKRTLDSPKPTQNLCMNSRKRIPSNIQPEESQDITYCEYKTN